MSILKPGTLCWLISRAPLNPICWGRVVEVVDGPLTLRTRTYPTGITGYLVVGDWLSRLPQEVPPAAHAVAKREWLIPFNDPESAEDCPYREPLKEPEYVK